MTLLTAVNREARLALRRIAARPGSAVAIVLLLVLGLAPVVALVATQLALLRTPLPYPDADRLVFVEVHAARLGLDLGPSLPYLHLIARESRNIAAIAGFQRDHAAVMADDGRIGAEMAVLHAQPALLDVLQVAVLHDTGARERVIADGATPQVLLGWHWWQRELGGDVAIIGRELRLNGRLHRVAGILPLELDFPHAGIDAWLLMPESVDAVQPGQAGSFTRLDVVARLAEGATVSSAGEEWRRLIAGEPMLQAMADEIGLRLSPRPLAYYWVRDGGASLRAVLAAASALLLVAVANASSLFMLRVWARRQETALAQVLGATDMDVFVRVVIEALLLAACAGLAAVALVPALISLLVYFALVPAQTPADLGIGGFGLSVTLVLTVLAALALASGAVLVQRFAVGESLFGAARAQPDSTRSKLVRSLLVGGQLALSATVLHAALLLGVAAARIVDQDLGYEREDVLVAKISAYDPATDVATVARRRGALAGFLESLQSTSGIDAAAFATAAPLGDIVLINQYDAGGDGAGANLRANFANYVYVGAGYFDALGLPLVAGQSFDRLQAIEANPVAIIDSTLAERHFGGRDAVGAAIGIVGPDGHHQQVTIIGVAATSRQRDLHAPDQYATIFLPMQVPYRLEGMPTDQLELVIRSRDPRAVDASQLARRLGEYTPELRIVSLQPMSARIRAHAADLYRLRDTLWLVAAVTLLLATAGLYAMFAGRVAAQQREFGIRKALGATPERMFLTVVASAWLLAATSQLAALPLAAWSGAHVLQLLEQPHASSALLLAAVALMLTILAGLAVVLPALRAAHADPLQCLTHS